MSEDLEARITRLTAKVTEANDNKFTFTLTDLIDEVQEEIKTRRYVYGNQVIQKRKTQKQAEKKIQAMENVLKILNTQRDAHIIRTTYTVLGHPLLIEYHGLYSKFREHNLIEELKHIFEKVA